MRTERDAVLWTSMLSAYARGGQPEEALRFFEGMVGAEVQLDAVVMVLKLGRTQRRKLGRTWRRPKARPPQQRQMYRVLARPRRVQGELPDSRRSSRRCRQVRGRRRVGSRAVLDQLLSNPAPDELLPDQLAPGQAPPRPASSRMSSSPVHGGMRPGDAMRVRPRLLEMGAASAIGKGGRRAAGHVGRPRGVQSPAGRVGRPGARRRKGGDWTGSSFSSQRCLLLIFFFFFSFSCHVNLTMGPTGQKLD